MDDEWASPQFLNFFVAISIFFFFFFFCYLELLYEALDRNTISISPLWIGKYTSFSFHQIVIYSPRN